MKIYELQKELETILKAETPDNYGMAYAKLWGIAMAYLTEEQLLEILKHRRTK
jgi:hypothetical protein